MINMIKAIGLAIVLMAAIGRVKADNDDDYDKMRFKLFVVDEFNETSDKLEDFVSSSGDDSFTISLRPAQKVITMQETFNMKPPGVAADHPVATSYVNIQCFYEDSTPCEFEFDITDSLIWHKPLYRHKRNNFLIKVHYYDYFKYFYSFTNLDKNKEVLLVFSHACEKCGQPKHKRQKFVESASVIKKTEILKHILSQLSHMGILLIRTKSIVYTFNSNMVSSVSRLLFFAGIECAALLLVAIWQVCHAKRLILRQNIL